MGAPRRPGIKPRDTLSRLRDMLMRLRRMKARPRTRS